VEHWLLLNINACGHPCLSVQAMSPVIPKNSARAVLLALRVVAVWMLAEYLRLSREHSEDDCPF